jgi:hypothetical protein
VGQLQSLVSGALSYLVFTGIGGFVGYFFAKKHTEHEVGYRRRVEVVERIQSLVASLAEGFEAALGYIREPGPAGGLTAKEIEGSIDELERYYVEQEIWLDGETLARLDALSPSPARAGWILHACRGDTATRTSSASTRGSGRRSGCGCVGVSPRPERGSRTRSGPCSGWEGGATASPASRGGSPPATLRSQLFARFQTIDETVQRRQEADALVRVEPRQHALFDVLNDLV